MKVFLITVQENTHRPRAAAGARHSGQQCFAFAGRRDGRDADALLTLTPRAIIFMLAWLLCAFFANEAQAQWVRQQFVLKPGWNAVFLEVDPTPAECDALFAGLPIESVWDWNPTADSAQFVQDPGTLIPGAPGWLTWFPSNHPLAGQGNLFILRDGRPYLIKMTNAQPVTWAVTGRPSLRRVTWRAEAVNLVGFHVGADAPSFQTLFAGESGLVGQSVYALDAGGAWRAFTDLSSARPKAGEAYWVRCRLPAQAAGTTLVDAGSSRGLTFGANAAEQSIRIRNASSAARQVSVRVLPSTAPPAGQATLAGPVPLEYWRASYATTNLGWEPLSAPLSFSSLPAGQEWNIRLGVRRSAFSSAMPGSKYQSLLEVRDDLGTRWLIPVSAEPAGATGAAAGFQAASAPGESPYAGLWIGDAVLNAVSQPAHPSDPSVTRSAGGSFSFRLIVHVDGTGTARLLQQVFLVRKPPIFAPDPNDPVVNRIEQPARTVAVTDESFIPGIIGTAELVGRRVSSPAFGFSQPVVLTGGAFGTGTLQGAFTLDHDHPLNPFKHVFHPDHNNLDERFEQKLQEGKESFTVARAISFEFTANDPLGLNPPGWGTTETGGVYRETITGLHRSAIQACGNFRLVRVLSAPTLNE
jgi:hypothetical protein